MCRKNCILINSYKLNKLYVTKIFILWSNPYDNENTMESVFFLLESKFTPPARISGDGTPYMHRINVVNDGDTKLDADLEIRSFDASY